MPGTIRGIYEDSDGRGCDESMDGRGVVVRIYRRKLWADISDPRVTPVAILSHVDLPQLLVSIHPDDPFARVVSRKPTQVDPYRYDIDIEYSTKWWDIADSNPNPLLRPAKFSRSTRDFQKPCDVDLTRTATYPDGQKCRNSAIEPFDPPLIHDCAAITILVEKNYEFFDPAWEDYLDPKAVNEGLFIGKEPGTVKINGIRSSNVRNENEVQYEAVQLEFHFRKTGWDEKPLDQGFSRALPPDGTIVPILDGGAVVARPKLLNGFGIPLPLGGTPVFLDGTVVSGVATAGPFITQPRKNFAIFGIT